MAQKTKQALIVENNQSFPNNTTGFITPTILRDFNTDIIDSLTTQIQFNENSDAVNNSLASLNAFTASAEGLNTGSLLITASFNNGTRNLTFTKGNSSQFSVNIPDVTGSELPTGLVSGSSQIDVTQTQNYSGINQYSDGKVLTYINTQGVVSGSVLRTLPAGIVSSSEQISELGYATTSSLNTYTQSVDDKFTNIGNQSGSWVTEAETASFARVDVANVFTQTQTINADLFVSGTINAYQINTTIESSSVIYSSGSNQFGDELSDIQTLSGSVKVVGELTVNGINVLTSSVDLGPLNQFTASQDILNDTFATTGSNQFNGNQNIVGQLTASALRVENNTLLDGTLRVTNDTLINGDITIQSATPNLKLRDTSGGGYSSGYDLRVDTGSFEIYDDTHDRDVLSDIFNPSTSKHTTSLTSEVIVISGSDSVTVQGGLTASLQEGYVWVGNSSGLTSQVSTSSLVVDITELNSFTSSQENKNNTLGSYTASIDDKFNTIGSQSGSWSGGGTDLTSLNQYTASNDTKWNTLGGETGSYARTNAPNTFTDTNLFQSTASFENTIRLGATAQYEILNASGALSLAASNFATGVTGVSHLQTQNPAGVVNLMFKDSNTQATTIISGSNNLFVNPGAAAAGLVRYIGGNGNIALNAGNVPLISGSMGYSPAVNNNYFGGNITTLTMRGPITSSGAWTIGGNAVLGSLNIGSTAANHAQGLSAGVSLTLNVIPGTLSVIANQSALTTAPNLTQNYIGGTSNILLRSSSLTMANNTIVDSGFNYTNEFYSSSVGLGSTAFSRNISFGANNAVTVFGTLPAGTSTAPTISDNAIFGGSNSIYVDSTNARTNGTAAYNGAQRNILLGNGLIVSGSNLSTDTTSLGSAFVGRWNSNDGLRNKSSDVVFAVGTGTSTTVRKTGFLVDSGSNTFVEGTFNVSGSTTFNGSISDTVKILSITSLTASLDAAVGNTFQLSLVDATDTRLEVSNARVGQTLNLLVSQSGAGTGTVSFGSNLYEPSGSFYSASAIANAKDIITLATFVETNVIYVANIKNLIL